MAKLDEPPIRPVSFPNEYEDEQNLPDLNDEEFDRLTAVLKALARGGYPRLDAVPLALNTYNCSRQDDDGIGMQPLAYFHPVTTITPDDVPLKARPEIWLNGNIRGDLREPWLPIRNIIHHSGKGVDGRRRSSGATSARYRFLCFIHKHKIDRKSTLQKSIHTISIWDREWDELTWHDTYHVGRRSRRREIQRFWQHVRAPGFIGTVCSRDEFMDSLRYRTVYHICEHIEDTMRQTVPPRHTLWAVMGVALFHMNNALEEQVSIVPDRLELFGAQAHNLLPRFFVHLLILCLEARQDWEQKHQKLFVKQLRITDRLGWMKARVREQLGFYVAADEDDDWNWIYRVLNL